MIRYTYPVPATLVGVLTRGMLEIQPVLRHPIIGGGFAHVPDHRGTVADVHRAVEEANRGTKCSAAALS
jgi:hypothetical protein